MFEPLRKRWSHVRIALLAVVLLGPTPVPGPLVQPLQAAVRALAGGRPAAAVRYFEATLQFEPALESLHFPSAIAALAAGDPVGALVHLEAAERLRPPEASLPCLRGRALEQLGQLASAVQTWLSAPEACLADADGLLRLEAAYRALGDRQGLGDTLQRLAEIEPENPEVAHRLGLLLATSEPERAMQYLPSAVSGSPGGDPLAEELMGAIRSTRVEAEPAYTLAQIGQVLGRAGEWELAVWAFENALAVRPEYHEARAYLGLALDRAGGDGERQMEAAAVGDPTASLPHIFLAMHHRGAGQPGRALNESTLAIELDPDNPVIYAEMAMAYESLGDLAAAKAAYLAAADLAPKDTAFWLLLAEFSIAHEIEVESLALPAARNAVALRPDDSHALSALGFAQFLVGDNDMAERSLRQALAIDPLDATLQYRWGLLRQARADLPGSIAALSVASQLDPSGAVGELARRTIESLAPYISARP